MAVIVALALMVVVEEAMAMVVAAVVVAAAAAAAVAMEAVLTNYELPCILVTVKRHWIAIKITL